MKVNDYVHVRKFENFCYYLQCVCESLLGKPDKLIIDTNIYLFVFEKGSFRFCIDSSESYCYPKDPDIYMRMIYWTLSSSSNGSFFIDEFPPISINSCKTHAKKCKKRIERAARIIKGPPPLEIWATIKSTALFISLYLRGLFRKGFNFGK